MRLVARYRPRALCVGIDGMPIQRGRGLPGRAPSTRRGAAQARQEPQRLALDLGHKRRWLDVKGPRDLHEFKDVDLSFTRFELPDE